jgi:hypothetical protein
MDGKLGVTIFRESKNLERKVRSAIPYFKIEDVILLALSPFQEPTRFSV